MAGTGGFSPLPGRYTPRVRADIFGRSIKFRPFPFGGELRSRLGGHWTAAPSPSTGGTTRLNESGIEITGPDLSEYENLKAEQLGPIGVRDNLVYATLAAAALALGAGTPDAGAAPPSSGLPRPRLDLSRQ